MKRFIVPAFLLLLAISFNASAADTLANDTVMATVNGVNITAGEVNHFLSRQPKVEDPEQALREMVNVELLQQAARDSGIMKDETLQLEIKRTLSSLIASTYLQQFLNNLAITEEQINARYQADYVDGTENTEFNANHILVKTEQEANDVIAELDQGVDFEQLARQRSTGPSGKNGGSLGWFKKEDMVEPFSKATAELNKGQYSKTPIQTQFGWHVILLNDTRQAEPPAIDSVRKNIATTIAAESIRTKMQSLRDAANIVYPETIGDQ